MKIEVDLDDIFMDEDGTPSESLQESIERQMVNSLTRKMSQGVEKQIDEKVSEIIGKKVQEMADTMLPSLAEDMINAEYTPVSTYGGRGEPTTFRKELVGAITSQLVYKKTQSQYDRNVFTKAVDAVIEENMKAFQAEFNKLVTDRFRDEALSYAVSSLKKTLGIK